MNFKTVQEKYLPIFEPQLLHSIDFTNATDERKILQKAIHHSVSAPGKRIRPLISMAVEQSLTNKINLSIPISIAIELVHCYSLIHDDLPAMDNDDFRRGIPTCHKAFGVDMAILAGDTLNSYAFEYLIEHLKNKIEADKLLEITQHFARACGIYGMAGGQVLDLKSSLSSHNSLEQLINIHALKTGALLEASFYLPGIALDASKETIEILKKAGQHFGLLFQIIDDILDEIGTLENLGKSPGKDNEQNKLTFTSKLGVKGAQKYAYEEKTKAIKLINELPGTNHDLTEIIEYIYSKGITSHD
ncbi:MAG: farnesyl diphosphate synthase [Candidatus Margulisiibacteriota bacterium]